MRRWFRFQVRKFIKPPKDLARAAVLRRRLAFCYLFIAWNTLGFYIYYHIKQEYPMTQNEKKMPALWYLRLIGENHADVISIEGLQKKSHVHIDVPSNSVVPVDSSTLIKAIYETEEVSSVNS